MKKGGRLVSYRWGDRAEELGIVLLKAICAVAPVPRQEDWGVFDAIATVLRREEHLLFAEGSFLVQFKSSGGNKFKFAGAKLDNLRSQDLPLFVASVDLLTATIELYPIGPALLDHDGLNPTTVYFHLKKKKKYVRTKDDFHVCIGPPALRWNITEMNAAEFQERTIPVLLSWLTLLKVHVQKTKLGIFDSISWTTGEAPEVTGYCQRSNPGEDEEALQITSIALKWLVMQALSHGSIASPVIQIAEWYASRGVPVDAGFLILRNVQKEMGHMIENALTKNPDASFAHALIPIETGDATISFWVGVADRMQKFTGSVEELLSKGFKLVVNENGKEASLVEVTAPWINDAKAKFLRFEDGVILYERLKEL